MSYDFDSIVNRKDLYSRKWMRMLERKSDIGEDIPPFSVADLDFRYPEILIEKFNEYNKEMIFGYSAPDDNYYNSFINWVERRMDTRFEREWLVDGNGVVAGIFNAINAFTKEKDGIIIMPPVYPPFKNGVEVLDRTLVNCPLIENEGHYTIDFELFEQLAKDENNKMLVFCSPHNPVGRVWNQEELEKLAKIAFENNVLVISDEVHMDFILEGHKHILFISVSDEAKNNSIILTSASKTFNLAGAQTSIAIIPNEIIRETFSNNMVKMGYFGLNTFGFKLFEIAYNELDDYFNEFLALINKNHKYLYNFINNELESIKAYKMEGTYLQWIDFSGLNLSDDEIFDFLVDKCQLFLTRGSTYGDGGDKFLRWNIATPHDVLKAGLERLKNGLESIE